MFLPSLDAIIEDARKVLLRLPVVRENTKCSVDDFANTLLARVDISPFEPSGVMAYMRSIERATENRPLRAFVDLMCPGTLESNPRVTFEECSHCVFVINGNDKLKITWDGRCSPELKASRGRSEIPNGIASTLLWHRLQTHPDTARLRWCVCEFDAYRGRVPEMAASKVEAVLKCREEFNEGDFRIDFQVLFAASEGQGGKHSFADSQRIVWPFDVGGVPLAPSQRTLGFPFLTETFSIEPDELVQEVLHFEKIVHRIPNRDPSLLFSRMLTTSRYTGLGAGKPIEPTLSLPQSVQFLIVTIEKDEQVLRRVMEAWGRGDFPQAETV